MINRLWDILYELYLIIMQVAGGDDVWVPPILTMFTYDESFSPNNDNVQHQMVDFDPDCIKDMIDEFIDNTDSLEFWTGLVGSLDNPENKEHIEWGYDPEGRQYPVKFNPMDLRLCLAFQLYVDLDIRLNKREEDEPHAMSTIFTLVGAYLYILLAAAKPEDQKRFYKHISGTDDFSFINHEDLLKNYVASNNIRNIII